MCMAAAELLVDSLRGSGGPVLIATGFPEGGGLPETDGPVGAVMLARALFLGLGVETVIVIDEDWEPVMRAACLGGGLSPMPFPETGVIEPIEFCRPIYIRTVPKDAKGCHGISDDLLERTQPRVLIAIEWPGCNRNGVYHALGGRRLDGAAADLDYLFRKGRERGIPSIGIGDGGNEPELEVRSIDLCAAAGGVDGLFEGTELAVDGITAQEWEGLIRSLRATVSRMLGIVVNWQGDLGDWRQVT